MLSHKHTFIQELAPESALEKSEDFSDPTANWYISREEMAKTAAALSLVTGVTDSSEAITHYRQMGCWIQNALEIQLGMSQKHAEQLATLMERSIIRSADYSEEDWQEYYEQSRKKEKGDKSWAASASDIREIICFLKQGIQLNDKFCVPFYAGLSDDKKTIYFDRAIKKIISTPIGDISPIDYVVLHERVEGAMMEQSYLEQLQKGKSQIQFVCPLNSKDENQFSKLLMTYQLVGGKLQLTYEVLASTKEENMAIESMDNQAIKQTVLSYEFAHQIAERIERATIYASGFGEIWESHYYNEVMKDIKMLSEEYTEAFHNGADLPHPAPSGLYVLPYAQNTNDLIQTNLLRLVIAPKLLNQSASIHRLFANNQTRENETATFSGSMSLHN